MNPLNPTAVVSMADELHPIKSRWGYHVCDFATYEKVRLLNFLCFDASRRAAARFRFDRKLLKNAEAVWERVRNEHNQPCGWRLVEGRKNVRPDVPLTYSRKYRPPVTSGSRGSLYRLVLDGPYEFVEELWKQVKNVNTVAVFPDRKTSEHLIKTQILLDPLVDWYRQHNPKLLEKFRDRTVPKH